MRLYTDGGFACRGYVNFASRPLTSKRCVSEMFVYLGMSDFKYTESITWRLICVFHCNFYVSVCLLPFFSPVLGTDFLDKKDDSSTTLIWIFCSLKYSKHPSSLFLLTSPSPSLPLPAFLLNENCCSLKQQLAHKNCNSLSGTLEAHLSNICFLVEVEEVQEKSGSRTSRDTSACPSAGLWHLSLPSIQPNG